MWLQPKSAHASSSLLYKWGNSGFKIAFIFFHKRCKAKIFEWKVVHRCPLCANALKSTEILMNFDNFKVYEGDKGIFALCFCYDLAHSTAKCAHFLAVDTSLAT